jgi:hypothetical protein
MIVQTASNTRSGGHDMGSSETGTKTRGHRVDEEVSPTAVAERLQQRSVTATPMVRHTNPGSAPETSAIRRTDLPAGQLESVHPDLLRYGTPLRRPAATVLCRESQIQREVIALLSGRIALTAGDVAAGFATESCLIGDPAWVGRGQWQITATTLTASDLVVFSIPDLMRAASDLREVASRLFGSSKP